MVGLGGAYRGYAEGPDSAILNPAGLSRLPSWWEGSFSFGSIKQKTSDLPDELELKNNDLFYVYMGLVFKVKQWRDFAFGVYVHSPTNSKMTGALNGADVFAFEYIYSVLSIPLSIRVMDDLYAGVRLKGTNAEVHYQTATREKKDAQGGDIDLGLLWQATPHYRVGLTYSPQDDLRFKDSTNTSNFTPFRRMKVPYQLYLGNSYQWNSRFITNFDLGLVGRTAGALLPGTAVDVDVPAVKSGRRITYPYHIGMEYLFAPKKWEGRMGHYYQPARYDGEPERFHVTGGLDYYFWYLKLSMAGDVAQKYYNLSLGLGLNFDRPK